MKKMYFFLLRLLLMNGNTVFSQKCKIGTELFFKPENGEILKLATS
jgi:hypothetical protein